MPHISFDLDGDGIVGNRDLVISKLFDKDGDGRLNTGERKNALDGIKNVSGLVKPTNLALIISEAKIFHNGLYNLQVSYNIRVSTQKWFGTSSSQVLYAPSE